MAIGSSGRIVIETYPEIKKELHLLVKKKGMNLKEWFESKIIFLYSYFEGQLYKKIHKSCEINFLYYINAYNKLTQKIIDVLSIEPF